MIRNEQQARRLVYAGLAVTLGAILPTGLWAGFAPLAMAVVAPAAVKVDLNRRPVQHLEGGIVRRVLVRDGQQVAAGEPVLELGDVGVDVERNRLSLRLAVEQAALARHDAEQQLAAAPAIPPALADAARQDPRIAQAIAKEQSLFRARRESLTSEVALMQAQRLQVEQEMSALRAQIAQGLQSHALQLKELEANRNLRANGFISEMRLGQIEAAATDYGARLDERRSELARAGQRLTDSDLRIRSAQNQYVQAASDQLKLTAARVAELEQELRRSEDAAARQVVTAPAAGEVIDLRFTSPGAVVRPGESIADIVPRDARLVLEARIRPEDIANVQSGQRARIKFTAFKYRNHPMVDGKVSYVAGDRLSDRVSGTPYYTVLVEADAGTLGDGESLKVRAGMPAEVYIEGSTQTALQYLMEPLTATMRKAARQM